MTGCRRLRTKGLLRAYKLLDMAQTRWRRLDGAHLLPLGRAGVAIMDGVQPEGGWQAGGEGGMIPPTSLFRDLRFVSLEERERQSSPN